MQVLILDPKDEDSLRKWTALHHGAAPSGEVALGGATKRGRNLQATGGVFLVESFTNDAVSFCNGGCIARC
jgi:hypothetical protein